MMADESQASKLCILNASVKPVSECDVFREHSQAHIPGARFLDLTVCRDISSPYPFMMPPKEWFVKTMKALNVRKSHTVVIYETGKGWFATRAAFMLRAYGHPRVLVLDGQFAKWQKEGRPVATDGADADFSNDFDYELDGSNMLSYERVKEVSADGSI